jgi:predicted anti-sigma-YlaC factor YlaD
MHCKAFQEHIYEYIDGTLSEELRKQADEHLGDCADCKLLYEEEFDFTNDPFTDIVEQAESIELKEETIQEITKRFGEK